MCVERLTIAEMERKYPKEAKNGTDRTDECHRR